ncbi:MAG: M6 family metalloprotease domain-containing protein [bacterium]|nr:M6 family metalloprotease domain-containing protein [bacterium]
MMNKKRVAVMIFVALFMLLSVFNPQMDADTGGPHFRPAKPGVIFYTQPDGSPLSIILKGDEGTRFARSIDGYTLLQNDEGKYTYGALNSAGDMVRSSIKAHNPGSRSELENRFLRKTGKNIFYSENQLKKSKRQKNDELSAVAAFPSSFPSIGNREVLVLLVGFTDVPFQLPQADFDGLMNQAGFQGTGSFKEYHQDNSFGQLNLTTTVVGPFTTANNMAYYGRNRGNYDARPRQMVAEALDAAEAGGLDFSSFDNDGDGNVDGIIVIHSGYDEAAGAPASSIWSHAWDLGNLARTYDGVTISKYCTSPELAGISGTNITDIGVLVHEFGHNLGLPDTYDTDYGQGGGQAYGLGYYDVMADGCWNNGGYTPANHTAYAKISLGWQTAVVLDGTPTSITLPDSHSNNISYRIDTATANEYFLLENRQQVGWDAYIEGHGLLIYHIDGDYVDQNSYDLNANPNHQGIDLEEADGTEDWGVEAAGDPFPGTTGNTSFNGTSSPAAVSWAGDATNVPLINIAENGGVIAFDVGTGGTGGDRYMYVGDISMTVTKKRKNYKAAAVVTIREDTGAAVAGATVNVTWGGVVGGTASGTTGSDGTVTFTTSNVRATGPFVITVDNVTHSAIQYDSALNIETSDSVTY